MFGRTTMTNSGGSPFKNSRGKIRKQFVNKRKPQRGLVNSMQSPLILCTSHGKESFKFSNPNPISEDTLFSNESFNFSNPNPIYEDSLYSNESPLQWNNLHEGNQLLSDFPQCSEEVEWVRTVRSMVKAREASTSSSSIDPRVGSDNREELRSTDVYRKLLFPEADKELLLKSEEVFKEHVKVLLDMLDLAVSRPSSWSRLDSNCFLNKIQSFAVNWSRELLKEKEKLVEEVWMVKERLKIKYDLVTNRLSLLTGVFEESATSMNFSEAQKQTMQSKMRELNSIKSKLIDFEGDNSVFSIASLTSHPKEKDRQLEESRRQVDKYREELRQTQNKLNATQAKLNGLVFGNSHKTWLVKKEMQDKLSEIRSMLTKKAGLGNHNSFYFTSDLNEQIKQIMKDIKNLIEDQLETKVQVTKENIQKTADSSVLKVTENEVHLVTLIASFMKVTPFPVSTEFIYMYVAKIDNVVSLQYVEKLLKKFPTFFKEEAIGPGSTEKNWSYLDLKPTITI